MSEAFRLRTSMPQHRHLLLCRNMSFTLPSCSYVLELVRTLSRSHRNPNQKATHCVACRCCVDSCLHAFVSTRFVQVMSNKQKKSEPQFRTCLTQTGAKLASDFILTLASATQEKKKKSKDTQSSTLGKERVVVKRSCFFLEPVCQKVRFSELAKAKPVKAHHFWRVSPLVLFVSL